MVESDILVDFCIAFIYPAYKFFRQHVLFANICLVFVPYLVYPFVRFSCLAVAFYMVYFMTIKVFDICGEYSIARVDPDKIEVVINTEDELFPIFVTGIFYFAKIILSICHYRCKR